MPKCTRTRCPSFGNGMTKLGKVVLRNPPGDELTSGLMTRPRHTRPISHHVAEYIDYCLRIKGDNRHMKTIRIDAACSAFSLGDAQNVESDVNRWLNLHKVNNDDGCVHLRLAATKRPVEARKRVAGATAHHAVGRQRSCEIIRS
ncbi:hypothetical protein A7982_13665 [Minicystis rosea]|nr:hypothetical protein A7982_13665 [Minicystis rosea]